MIITKSMGTVKWFAKVESIKAIWDILSPRRRRQLLGLQFLSLAGAVGEVANLGALLPVLRLLARPTESLSWLGPLATPLLALPEKALLLTLGIGFVVVVVLSTMLRTITIRTQLKLTAVIAADLGEKVFAVVLRKPFAWHLQQNSSRVLGNITKDVEQANACIKAVLLMVVNVSIVVLLGGSLIMLAPDIMLLISLLLSCFYLLTFRFTRGALKADGQRLTKNYQSSLQIAQEGLGGIRDVLLDRSQTFFLDSYKDRNRKYQLAAAAINIKSQIPRYLIEGFAIVVMICLALGLALQGQGIEQQLPLLGTVALGAYRLLQPLQQCFSALSTLQGNQASLDLLQPFLIETSTADRERVQKLQTSSCLEVTKPMVQLKELSFRYGPKSPWVLRGLNFEILQGEQIAFVGSTGSGKTTTSDLILGLLAPSEGKLLVQGKDIHGKQGLVQTWQQRVAHVPQSIYLSDSSFAGNIAFGVPETDVDMNRVKIAAKQAQIAELIESSREGYDSMVGERGVQLSGGQRQRIGLARALYKQAELLVLDEATSALDNTTEAEVMGAIESLHHKITVIIIAHRLSTIQNCDRILFLEQGTIQGLGSYSELLEGNAEFRRLACQGTEFIHHEPSQES